MKIAFFDCQSGIAGDMTLSALIDAGASVERIQAAFDSLKIGPLRVDTRIVDQAGFRARQLQLSFPPEHAHRHLSDILGLIDRSQMSRRAKELASRIFQRIGHAEAKVHGIPVEQVHFHEVGALDSIADIVGVAVAWDDLEIEQAFSSPLPLGHGHIEIAHGRVSLPAPATAELLKGIPTTECLLPVELTTPTGAAIVAELADRFGAVPSMTIESIGYGAGTAKLIDRPNLLRVLIGKLDGSSAISGPAITGPTSVEQTEWIGVLETNIDDLTGEQIGFAFERLLDRGALDVFSTPCQMKKNRPGVLVTVLCRQQDVELMKRLMFDHLGTLGIRCRNQARWILPRRSIDLSTPWGIVRAKLTQRIDGSWDCSPEFDDCQQIAIEHDLALADVAKQVTSNWEASKHLQPPPSPISVAPTAPDHSHDHSHDHGHSHHHS